MKQRWRCHYTPGLAISFDLGFLIAYLVGLATLFAGLTITHFSRPYSSDDVVLQTILATWRQGYHDHAYLGVDSFILKLPFYAVLDALVPGPRPRLLVTVLLFNGLGYSLFALACRIFWQPLRASRSVLPVVSLVWLAIIGTPFYVVLITPNVRNLEIGASFLLLAIFAKYLRGEFVERSVWFIIAAASLLLFLGLFIYDDPFFMYFLELPLVVSLVVYDLLTRVERRHVYLAVYLVLSIAVFKVWGLIFRSFGLYTSAGAEVRFTTLDKAGYQLRVLVESWVQLFQANFFGAPVMSTATMRSAVVLSLLTLLLIYPVYLFRNSRFRCGFWPAFIAVVPWFSIAAFGTSYVFDVIGGKRYLVLIPFAMAITAGFLYQDITQRKFRLIFVGLLVANVLLNAYSMRSAALAMQPNPNAGDEHLIATIEGMGLTKGYTDYWLADINTYLSNYRVNFIAVDCGAGSLHLGRLLGDDGILAVPASKTFYLYDSTQAVTSDCDIERLRDQFGLPEQVISIGPTERLAIYDYDIGSKL